MKSLRRIRALVMKEVRQLRRDRLTFGMIVGVPTLQIILFGYAINTDVRNQSAAVVDHANTTLSRSVTQDMAHSQVIELVAQASDVDQLKNMIRRGEIRVGIVIPHDFERRLTDPSRAAIQLLVDGSDPVMLSAAQNIARIPINTRAGEASLPPPAQIEVRTYYNPERRSAVNIVPALIGVILTMTMVLFTSVAIVRERERGNLELLITTPVKTVELMVAKILPYVLIGIIQTTIVLALGILLFDVPIRGSWWDIYAAALIFIGASLTLGLMISTMASTQFQAVQMMIFVFLPSILLSGFMFPFEGMPRAAQIIAEGFPLTHFVRLIRGIVLRGAELTELTYDLYALLIFGAIMLTVAVLRFRKRLD